MSRASEPVSAATYVAPEIADGVVAKSLSAEIYAEEIAAINGRRDCYALPRLADEVGPPSGAGAVGLAFSGGGIRSASVNIGVIQALDEAGILERIDYLSTVSGGGFAGAALSSSLQTAPDLASGPATIRAVAVDGGGDLGEQSWTFSREDLEEQGFLVGLELVHDGSVPLLLRASAETENVEQPVSLSLVDGEEEGWHRVWMDRGAWGVVVERPVVGKLRLRVARQPFPSAFKRPEHLPESPALQHIREFSDYLQPRGLFSGLRIPALFLMGIVTNVFALVPVLLLVAVTTYLVWSTGLQQALCTNSTQLELDESSFEGGHLELDLQRYMVMPESCKADPGGGSRSGEQVLVNLINLPRAAHIDPEDVSDPDFSGCRQLGGDRSHTLLECVGRREDAKVKIGLPAFDDPFSSKLALTIRSWEESYGSAAPRDAGSQGTATSPGPADSAPTFADPVSELSGTLLLTVGFLFVFLLFLIMYSMWRPPAQWQARDFVTRVVFGAGLTTLFLLVAVGVQPLATYYFASLAGAPKTGRIMGGVHDVVFFSTSLATVIAGLLARSKVLKDVGRKALVYVVAVLGFLSVWLLSAYFTLWLLDCEHLPLYDWLMPWLGECRLVDSSDRLVLIFVATALTFFLISYFLVNVNKTSFHHFYRDRLSAAFSMDPWRGRVRHVDLMPLQSLATSRGPFHLVNATINLPRTEVGLLKGRGCDFFLFTPRRIGSQITGYCETGVYAGVEGRFDLNSAIAISGAAAAPTMGLFTNRALTFLMALLNVRLDYWAHNPRLHASGRVRLPGVGVAYLFREMLGELDEESRFINLSDGGHIENLGAYELVRRRCKLIIASDCQADAQMTFDGLADLIRLVRIDMGVEIDIDVTALERDEEGLSSAHFAIGSISYPEGGEKGVLVYLKATVTGDEGIYIDSYMSLNPSFPNETTADQFFDEPQFEAYRTLGQHMARQLVQCAPFKAMFARDALPVEEVLALARAGSS